MSKIHLIMQSKGGVGKSMIAYYLAQYLIEKKGGIIGFDTDLHNHTFENYKALGATSLALINQDTQIINTKALDDIIEATTGNDKDVVIDVGSSSFSPFYNYILENDTASYWKDIGHKLYLHTVITGRDFLDCTKTFDQIINHFGVSKNCRFIVWLNPFFGPVEYLGNSFTDTQSYKENSKKIAGMIAMPMYNKDTYMADFIDLTKMGLTFDEGVQSPDFKIAEKQRIRTMKKRLFEILDQVQELL